MGKILVTGGPVSANLDAVKIITNKFRGGRMAELAQKLAEEGNEVTYLCSKEAKKPPAYTSGSYTPSGYPTSIDFVHHGGYCDYRNRVLDMAPDFDATILGAAVVNLIPDERWMDLNLRDGKFPSHDYEEHDPVPILFRIAPRVINIVKDIAPKKVLMGFKLLSGVSDSELVRAARLTCSESKAQLIIANDAKNLDRKIAVTPEGYYYPCNWVSLISKMVNDCHYFSVVGGSGIDHDQMSTNYDEARAIAEKRRDRLEQGRQENGLLFGCVAVRGATGGFTISTRGKTRIEDFTWVREVDHDQKCVVVSGGEGKKASLNAPLIDRIFKGRPDIHAVIHWHNDSDYEKIDFPLGEYAAPGTMRDTNRGRLYDNNDIFGVAGHGMYMLLRKEEC